VTRAKRLDQARIVKGESSMKRFLKWTAALGALTVAGAFAVRGVQATRLKLKNALGQAEAVADQTRAALEHTEAALRTARTSI
jgi:hypothetical protein